MRYRMLGEELNVSAVGLGCMGMSHAYGAPADEGEMTDLIAKAVDAGYTLFDTAESYGTKENPHANEVLVGRALKPYRHQVVIATKFGISFGNAGAAAPHTLIPDSRPETIRRAVDGSLERLGTDYIDLYYQHRQDPDIPVEEVAGVMADLICEGKIRHWGLSAVNEDIIRRADKVCHVTAVQNRYSMMYRDTEQLFPVLEELHIGLVPFSPMANGFLTGKYAKVHQFGPGDYRAFMPQFTAESEVENRRLLQYLQDTAAAKGMTDAQLSLAWMICKKPYIVPIPGSTKLARILENGGAADVLLTPEEVDAIDKALDAMPMSAVFGGSPVRKTEKGY
ncbi:MAG TPA: aldo/keto reductase [Acidaminococcaceae bacterium]|nr:aldo/keto reductase [Acidaminococcaceae bacterium]